MPSQAVAVWMTARCKFVTPRYLFIVGGFEDEPYFDSGRRDVSRDRRHRLDWR